MGPPTNGKGEFFTIFVPKNFSISISFSTFMAPKQPFTYNEIVIFHWLIVCSIYYSVSAAMHDREEKGGKNSLGLVS